MDTLPIEAWHHIFSFVCTDGGFTGASLGRTSRAFRAASVPYRFHSVQLSSINGVDKFLSAYEAALASASALSTDTPHVRHLLFAFLPGKVDMAILGDCFHFRDFHSWQQAKIGWNERFVARVTRLFGLIAPRLETLTVLQCADVPLPYVRCEPFPTLRELTILYEDTLFVRSLLKELTWIEPKDDGFFGAGQPPTLEELAATPTFPALERLYLANGTWTLTLPMWAAAAPRLTYLRVSAADEATGFTLWELLDATGSAQPRNWSVLQTVVLQAKFNPDATQREARAGILHDVGAGRTQMQVELEPELLAPANNTRLPEWAARLTGEWMARAVGERGSW